jgi:uncharacterized coiled-coil protein SlyX
MAETLVGRVGALERRVARVEDTIERLDTDIAEIKTSLGHLATKADLNGALNGVLRDALNSLPGRWSAAFMLLMVLIAFGGMAANLMHAG